MKKIVLRNLIRAYRYLYAHQFNPRYWSNNILRNICKTLEGDVLNVSGGDDGDKQGDVYRSYFSAATSYSISNFGDAKRSSNISLDLTSSELPQELTKKFDIVFSHTVLEHIFDIHSAIGNLCSLSKSVVISVVPFLQSFHHGPWYSDYWRFTPNALVGLFEEKGFRTAFVDWNEDFLGNIYIVHVAVASPEMVKLLPPRGEVKKSGPGRLRTALLGGGTIVSRSDAMDSNLATENGCITLRIR